ncbi:MAG: dolichol-phosphate mannosyltransferase [Xenococcaceae cyanobacterium MO_207.B15]|nr:dolichol-phosphate mannosyltransferase [Xenococcaceae cyanobacterium MO_207.B15]
MKLKYLSVPVVIILVGILFSLYLQGKALDGVYFSGDGGLKALLAKQLGSGTLRFDLVIPQETWIQDLWNDGLYPYDEPYVYHVADKYYITFPYTFPLVTAPFYAWFGERGLYIVPLVSCWIVWLVFYLDCVKLKLDNFVTTVGLILLIFSSYLTVYSAMYWEHTLAVALCFSGLSLWCIFGYPQGNSKTTAILSGIFIGLSVWFRPEFLCMVAVITGVILVTSSEPLLQKTPIHKFIPLKEISFLAQQKILFLSSMFLTVGGFFLSNKLIYGYALGIHGIQVVEKPSISDRLIGAWNNFTGMTLALPEYLPIINFALLYLFLFLIQKIFSGKNNNTVDFNLKLVAGYLGCLLFIIGVSILVPVGTAGLIAGGKQWGVRFFLILVPITILVTTLEFKAIKAKANKLIYNIALITIVALGTMGIYTNSVQATQLLDKNNQDIQPAVAFLRENALEIVAISHEFVGQALEAATNNKIFFTVPTESEIIKLSQGLIRQQKTKFTYICYPHRRCNLPKANPENLQFTQDNQQYQIKFNSLGKFGKYPIYEITIDS